MSSLEPTRPERYPPGPRAGSGFPPGGGDPPPEKEMTIPVRTAVILSLSVATGGGTAALYLTTPAPIATAVVAAVAACGAAIRVLSRVIR